MKKALVVLGLVTSLFSPKVAFAQAKNVAGVTLPTISLGFQSTEKPDEVVNVIKIIILLTVLTLAPAILNHDDEFHPHRGGSCFFKTSSGHSTNAA